MIYLNLSESMGRFEVRANNFITCSIGYRLVSVSVKKFCHRGWYLVFFPNRFSHDIVLSLFEFNDDSYDGG